MIRKCDNKCCEFDDEKTQGWLKLTGECIEPVMNGDGTDAIERLRGTIWICAKCMKEGKRKSEEFARRREYEAMTFWDVWQCFNTFETLEVLGAGGADGCAT